jgi:hypothetical protein
MAAKPQPQLIPVDEIALTPATPPHREALLDLARLPPTERSDRHGI